MVQRGGVDVDDDLSRARRRRRELLQLEHRRGAEPDEPRRSHVRALKSRSLRLPSV